MKRTSLILSIGVIALLCIFFIIYSCKKDEGNNNSPSPNTAPVAAFTVSPASGSTQTSFLFDASNSSDKEDATSVLQVRWDWDNDGVWDTDWSSDKDVNHTYAQEGNYNVSLEVKDTQGLYDATSNSVLVSDAGGNDPPVAGFIADNTSVLVGQTIIFTDQSSNGPISWQWDFGDGGTSTDQNPSHTYITEGTYSVSLIAANSYGNDAEVKTNFITVSGGTGEPCPGIPSFTYHGQTYNTVLIGNQCWMKENLNYATGSSWCYDDDPANCNTYGRLYDWAAVMNGEASSNSVPSGVQGICPAGWHVPGDEEWKILEGTVDSQYGVGDPEWDDFDYRGYDAGKNLKSTSGWYLNGNGADLYGFVALPGGYRYYNGDFYGLEYYGLFWSSSEYDATDAWTRYFSYGNEAVRRSSIHKGYGFSVRCLKD